MTGEKNKFSTTEKLWNLDDKQLKTPKHDAMVLWLMENIKELLPFKESIKDGEFIFTKIDIKSESPIKSSVNFIAGFADLLCYAIYESKNRPNRTRRIGSLIEVKPYIDSFGAVLRQIKTYKNFIETSKDFKNGFRINSYVENYYIFTLDTRFDKQFESQGIHILHPPEDFDIDEVIEYYGL